MTDSLIVRMPTSCAADSRINDQHNDESQVDGFGNLPLSCGVSPPKHKRLLGSSPRVSRFILRELGASCFGPTLFMRVRRRTH